MRIADVESTSREVDVVPYVTNPSLVTPLRPD